MQPVFGYAILYVPSVPEAIAFYERAFGFSNSFLHEGQDYGELQTGATKLAFVSHQLAKTSIPFTYHQATEDGTKLGVEWTFVTDDVDALFARALREGAKPLSEPHDEPWGQRVSYVSDLNGFAVGIASPVGG